MVAERTARGEVVARGNTSNVRRWTRSCVVKVLRPEIPRDWATLEADITRRVFDAGLPVPRVDGVVEVDGCPGVVLERINGTSMWAQMKSALASLPKLVEELVDLQLAILRAGPIDGLPDLVARVRTKIDAARTLPDDQRLEAQRLLSALPLGAGLCHGDMHPANLLASRRGWIVVDWFDAAVGHPAADMARSSLLMPSRAGLRSARRHLDGATGQLVTRLHVAYLASLERRGLLTQQPFDAWQAVLAVARMSEPVPSAELHGIWRAWRRRTHSLLQ